MKFFKYGNKGFTLIELLVVIAILGTLAGVVVLNVIQFIGKGACEAATTELHNVQTAAVAYSYCNAGAIPEDEGDLAPFLLTNTKYTGYTFDAQGKVLYGAVTPTWPGDCTP